MPATILPKRNSIANSVPPASSLTVGELAVNTADGRIYIKNSANSVINLAVSSIAGQAISPSSVSTTGDINAATGAGFKINNTAASGSYLRGNGSRFVSNTIQSGDLGTGTANSAAYLRGDRTWQTLNASAVGLGNVSNTAQVTAVSGTAPIVSSGGTTPAISISAATTSAAGSMSAADKLKLDGIAANANNYSLPATVFRNDATNAGDLRFAAADGRGMRFWDSDSFKIWMSAATDATWGGRLDSTSDYNMYFRFAGGGTNRGFVFKTNAGNAFQIESSGSLRTAGTALTASAGFGLVATGNNVITATTNNVERVRITGAGDVGVGITNPASKLVVAGNVDVYVDATTTKDSIRIQGRDGGTGSRRATLTTSELGGNRMIALPDANCDLACTFNGNTITNGLTVNQKLNSLRNNLGDPTAEELALFHGQFTNKFRFIPPTLQEESTNGTTWTTSTKLDASAIKNLMIGEGQGTGVDVIPIAAIDTYGGYRLTCDVVGQTGYVFLNMLYIYSCACGNLIDVKIEKYNPLNNAWSDVYAGVISNYPGHTTIKHSTIAYHPSTTAPTTFNKVRVTFESTHSSNTNGFTLHAIEWFGGYPGGQRRNVESYDGDKNVTFPAYVRGTYFVATTTTLCTNLNADLLDGRQGAGYLSAANNVWQNSDDSQNRLYFGANSTSYYKSPAGHVFRHSNDTTLVSIGTDGSVASIGQYSTTRANATSNGTGQIYLDGATGNRIDFNTNGYAAPSFGTRSVGTKIVLYPNVGASSTDYAIGIEASTLWNSVPLSSNQFKWYAGTTNIATLTGAGNLTVTGSVNAATITKSSGTDQDFLMANGETSKPDFDDIPYIRFKDRWAPAPTYKHAHQGGARFVTIQTAGTTYITVRSNTGYFTVRWWDGTTNTYGTGSTANTFTGSKALPSSGAYSGGAPKEIYIWPSTSAGVYTQGAQLTFLSPSSYLIDLDCDNNPALTALNLSWYYGHSLSFQNLPALTSIAIYNGGGFGKTVDLSGLLALTSVQFINTGLEKLLLPAAANLHSLMTDGNSNLNEIRAVGVSGAGTYWSKWSYSSGISVVNNDLSAAALNQFFTDLAAADSNANSPYIFVSGNPGSATCNTSIATNKGYAVLGAG